MTPGSDTRLLIAITTKNRQEELLTTLRDLEAKGFGRYGILVVDDGSDPPLNLPRCSLDLRVVRFPFSEGLIVRRNWMVSESPTPYVLSLDDDSSFRDACDLRPLLDRLDEEPSLAALALNIEDPEYPLLSESNAPAVASHYTGCGHIVRRSSFLEIGGYRDFFVHMCEEIDFGLRVSGAGMSILSWPAVVVVHRRVLNGRNEERNWRLSSRNLTCSWLLNLPWSLAIFRTIRTAGAIARGAGPGRSTLGGWAGMVEGVAMAWNHRSHRKPIPFGPAWNWLRRYSDNPGSRGAVAGG